jgi:DNA-binding SARP family transcriptional activator
MLLSRQHIAFTFWPDVPEDKARNNLRQLVHQMRHALPEADRFLQADASALGWLNPSDFLLDVAEYEAAAQAGLHSNDAQQAIALLEKAAGLYRGDLLPGCYDDWVAPERERLRQSFASVLDRLAMLYEAERNLPAAIVAMQRRLELDPLHEDSYVTLMRLHALNWASRQASRCRRHMNV